MRMEKQSLCERFYNKKDEIYLGKGSICKCVERKCLSCIHIS